MNTAFLLMAQYDGRAVVPVDQVCADYFPHLTPEKFLRKVSRGGIAIPVVRIEASQMAAKGVRLADLAAYIDQRREIALRGLRQLHR